MTLAELLSAALEHVQGLSPVQLVGPNERAIKIRLGHIVGADRASQCHGREYGPGWRLVVPGLETLHTVDVSLAAVHGPTQTIETHDGITVAFAASVRYRVQDVGLMYVSIYEVDDVVGAAIGGAATRALSEIVYAESSPQEIENMIFSELSSRFESWGLDLEEVCIQTLVPARVFRLVGD